MNCTFGLINIRKRTHDERDPISLRKFEYKFNPIWFKAQMNFLMNGDQKCSTCGEGPFVDFIHRDKHKRIMHNECVVR